MGLRNKLLIIAAALSLAAFGFACGGSSEMPPDEPAMEETMGGEDTEVEVEADEPMGEDMGEMGGDTGDTGESMDEGGQDMEGEAL